MSAAADRERESLIQEFKKNKWLRIISHYGKKTGDKKRTSTD